MAIMKWDPWRDVLSLRDEMDRLFEDFLTKTPEKRDFISDVWAPDVDIYETKDEVIVKAELPGMKKDDIKISIVDNSLIVEGEKKQEKETKDENYYRMERRYGAFRRVINLPVSVKINEIDASYDNGVLEIKLPKSEEAKPKEIEVKIK